MNTKATAKYIHISPRKVRLVVDLVRGLDIAVARQQLTFSNKAAAKPVLKVLNSAVANAENNAGEKIDGYVVAEAFVDEAPTIKRFRPRAHGRAAAIRKRMSHITVAVGPKAGEEKKKAAAPEKKVATKTKAKKPAVKKAPEAKAEEKAVKKKTEKKTN